jgi:hypothetical protein
MSTKKLFFKILSVCVWGGGAAAWQPPLWVCAWHVHHMKTWMNKWKVDEKMERTGTQDSLSPIQHNKEQCIVRFKVHTAVNTNTELWTWTQNSNHEQRTANMKTELRTWTQNGKHEHRTANMNTELQTRTQNCKYERSCLPKCTVKWNMYPDDVSSKYLQNVTKSLADYTAYQ